MVKKFMFLLVLVLFVVGCSSGVPDAERDFVVLPNDTSSVDLSVCGDGVCSLTEDCNNCPEDCGCDEGYRCSSASICVEEICGDGICSDEERALGSCCQDCGCDEGFICNFFIQECQEEISLNQDVIERIVSDYLKDKGINGSIVRQYESYYGDILVNFVSINCADELSEFVCEITLVINEEGEILEEFFTS